MIKQTLIHPSQFTIPLTPDTIFPDEPFFLSVAQLMELLFNPRPRLNFIVWTVGVSQGPEVLAGMVEVEQLNRMGPAVGHHAPYPLAAVGQGQCVPGFSQSGAQGLPAQPLAQFHRLALKAHNCFLTDHSPSALGVGGLFLSIEDSGFDFVPFHALFAGSFTSPARSTKSGHPAVHHQNAQLGGFAFGVFVQRQLFEAFLGVGFGLAPQALNQRVNDTVVNRTSPAFGQTAERRFVVLRERLREEKEAVGRKLIDVPGYVFRIWVTNRSEEALELWHDYNGRATIEQRIEELKNDLAADGFCTQNFWATESAFLAVLFTFNLLSLYQKRASAQTGYRHPSTLRTGVFLCGAILGKAGHQTMLHLSSAWGGLDKHKTLVEAIMQSPESTSPKLDSLANILNSSA